MSAGPVLVEKWTQPPIPLIDPDSGNKVTLKLRRMSFAREIHSLPNDMLEIHNILIEQRASRNAAIYMVVAAWNRLRSYEKYWTSFNFGSEEEYLIYYGLPDGSTLAGWTIMVNLFDKPTFVLLGDEVLSFLMRSIGQYQDDTDERKKDYQAIFDSYCASRDSFDKAAFYNTVRHHIRKRYEEPLARKSGLTHDAWKSQQSHKMAGSHKRRQIIVASPSQSFGPRVESDFSWKNEDCRYCLAYDEYVTRLEKIIVEKCGEGALPKRPHLLTRD